MAAKTWRSWEFYDDTTKRWVLLTEDILDSNLETMFKTIDKHFEHPIALCIQWKRYDEKCVRSDIMRPHGIGFDPRKLIRCGYNVVQRDVPVQMNLYRNGFLPESEIVVLYRKTVNSEIEILIFDNNTLQVCIATPNQPSPPKQVSAPPVPAVSTASTPEKVAKRKSKTESDLAQAVLSDLSEKVSRLSTNDQVSTTPPEPTHPHPADEPGQPKTGTQRKVGRRDFLRVSVLDKMPRIKK